MDPEQIRNVVERATLAPSIHNTQPWRFVATDQTIDVFADRSRAVPVVDPTGRQLLISCGAAVEFGWLAVRALGLTPTLTVLPADDDPDHVARLTVGDATPATPEEVALVRAMPRRHTDRLAFDPRPVPSRLIDELRGGVEERDAWLRPVTDEEEVVVTSVLLADADVAEEHRPEYHAEIRRWLRSNAGSTDGIPEAAVRDLHTGRRASTVRLRAFGDEPAVDQPVDENAQPPQVERPFLALLGTADDNPRAWIDAGRALGWLLLRATLAGVTASPLGQVTDLPATRLALGPALGLLGHPQLLLRLGFGHGTAETGRRPVDEVLNMQ